MLRPTLARARDRCARARRVRKACFASLTLAWAGARPVRPSATVRMPCLASLTLARARAR
jgi:hypothetical protein